MRTFYIFILVLIALFVIVLVLLSRQPLPSWWPDKELRSELIVAFLDVGQGDATLLTFNDGSRMLIDCGKDARVLEALGRHMTFFEKNIDYLVLTHPDFDHYGGCIDVLARYSVGTIISTSSTKPHAAFAVYLESVINEQSRVVTIDHPQNIEIASSTVSFLFPHLPVDELDLQLSDSNNQSIIAKVVYGEHSLLLPGDAEKEGEEALLALYGTSTLDVTILKAGHHGSSGSTSDIFLAVTSPEHVIFSAGRNNSYGHPSERVILKSQRAGAKVWRTDTQGDILASLGDEVYVQADN